MQVDLGRLDVQIYPFDEHKQDYSKANIIAYCEEDKIILHINTNNIFSSLLMRYEVVGALNKKLDELVQKHLAKEAEKQKLLDEEK